MRLGSVPGEARPFLTAQVAAGRVAGRGRRRLRGRRQRPPRLPAPNSAPWAAALAARCPARSRRCRPPAPSGTADPWPAHNFPRPHHRHSPSSAAPRREPGRAVTTSLLSSSTSLTARRPRRAGRAQLRRACVHAPRGALRPAKARRLPVARRPSGRWGSRRRAAQPPSFARRRGTRPRPLAALRWGLPLPGPSRAG